MPESTAGGSPPIGSLNQRQAVPSLRNPLPNLRCRYHPAVKRQFRHVAPLEILMMPSREVTVAGCLQQDVERQVCRTAAAVAPLETLRNCARPIPVAHLPPPRCRLRVGRLTSSNFIGFTPLIHLPIRPIGRSDCVRLLRCRCSLLVALRFLFRHGRRAVPSPFN